MTVLTEKLVESDQEKEQLKLEVRSANICLQDVQQRLHTLQVPTKYYHFRKLWHIVAAINEFVAQSKIVHVRVYCANFYRK